MACAWIGVFGHSTEDVLRKVLQIKARGICARLCRSGLLVDVAVPLSNVKVWTLTKSGLRTAELALGRRVAFMSHPRRLTLSRLTHELAVQGEAVARLTTDLEGIRRLTADRELRGLRSDVRPDLLVRHVDERGGETQICLEVEISSKGTPELRAKMAAMLGVITPRTLWIWCITEGETTRDRYERTWRSVVDEIGDGYALSAEQLRRACHFEVVRAAI